MVVRARRTIAIVGIVEARFGCETTDATLYALVQLTLGEAAN
jgi:hypothetical protein